MKSLAILNASQLVTIGGPARPRVGNELSELAIVEDGALFAEDGIIKAVGKTDDIRKLVQPGTESLDCRNKVVLPGFVDAHTHLVFSGNRIAEFEMRSGGATYEEIAAAGGGIQTTVDAVKLATAAELLREAAKHAGWMMALGTTTAEAKSGYGLDLEGELKILRTIRSLNESSALEVVPTFLGAHACPRQYKEDKRAYVDLVINQMLPAIARENLAEYCDVFCEEGYFSCEEARRISRAAKAFGLGVRLHADQLSCGGGAQLAAELVADTADHLEQTESEGISAMAAAGVKPVLLPGSVYVLGKQRYPRARDMVAAGLAIVLATDFNPGSSPTPSMPMVMSLACTQMRLSPAEAIVASTINPAYSLRRGDRLGSLEPGKQADLTIFDCADYREIAYYFGLNLTNTVVKKGKPVRLPLDIQS